MNKKELESKEPVFKLKTEEESMESDLQSDDSYYEEVEDVHLACLTENEQKVKEIVSENLINIRQESEKLNFIFKMHDIIHDSYTFDRELPVLCNFL